MPKYPRKTAVLVAAALLCSPLAAQSGETDPKICPISSEWAHFAGNKLPTNDIINFVHIQADGQISWNGSKIDDADLDRIVGLVAKMPRRVLTSVINQGADCDRDKQVRLIVEKHGCENGVCLYAPNIKFEPNSPPPPPSR